MVEYSSIQPMTPAELAQRLADRVALQDLELQLLYGLRADAVAMHPDDAKIIDASTLCGMAVYVDAGMVPGEPEIISPEEAKRRYANT